MCARTSRHEGLNLARGPVSSAPQAYRGPGPCVGTAPRTPSPLPPPARGCSPRTGRGWTAGKDRGWGAREAAAGPHCSSCCPRVTRPSRPCSAGSHMARWGGRGHRVPLSGLRGPSWEIPRSCPPLASPLLAQPGRRKREPRADTSSSASAAAAVPVAAAAAGPAVSSAG